MTFDGSVAHSQILGLPLHGESSPESDSDERFCNLQDFPLLLENQDSQLGQSVVDLKNHPATFYDRFTCGLCFPVQIHALPVQYNQWSSMRICFYIAKKERSDTVFR